MFVAGERADLLVGGAVPDLDCQVSGASGQHVGHPAGVEVERHVRPCQFVDPPSMGSHDFIRNEYIIIDQIPRYKRSFRAPTVHHGQLRVEGHCLNELMRLGLQCFGYCQREPVDFIFQHRPAGGGLGDGRFVVVDVVFEVYYSLL